MNRNSILNKLKELLGKRVRVYIDRPINSRHPKHGNIVYGVNYGYIKDIIAPDNEYQDVYVLGVDTPIDSFDGTVIAIINRTNDIEDKLVVAPEGKNFSSDEIEKAIGFQEKYFEHIIIC